MTDAKDGLPRKTPSAQQNLEREEIRAELVALDVLERLLSPARQGTRPRLPRLPEDARGARREAKRLAAQSMTRSLRNLERIARNPDEAPLVRLEVAQLLLGRARLLPGKAGAEADAKKEPKVIVVNRVPRPPKRNETTPAAPPPPAPPPPLSGWDLAAARERAAAEEEEEAG